MASQHHAHLLSTVALGAAAWAVWHFLLRRKSAPTLATEKCKGADLPYVKHPASSYASYRHATQWHPRPTDVIICTYTKAGTTWTQQICHQLRTGGSMDFDEITAVSPWLDFALDAGVSLDADQLGPDGQPLTPRLWKSHQRLSAINAGCKYIVTLRHPVAVASSYYHFYRSKGLVPDGMTLDDWALRWAGGRGATWCGPIWPYYTDYFARRHDPSVLILCFEDLREDLPKQVARIATFIGVPCGDELCRKVCEHSSSDFMARRASQFDDHWLHERQLATGSYGDYPMSMAVKVALPQTAKLSDGIAAQLEERWRECVTPLTGAATYEELRKKMRCR